MKLLYIYVMDKINVEVVTDSRFTVLRAGFIRIALFQLLSTFRARLTSLFPRTVFLDVEVEVGCCHKMAEASLCRTRVHIPELVVETQCRKLCSNQFGMDLP